MRDPSTRRRAGRPRRTTRPRRARRTTSETVPPDPTRPDAARPDPPVVRLSAGSLTDLLQLVPYLLGFHPHDSVVAVLLQQRRVLVTARVDLGPAVPGLAEQMARITHRDHATGMIIAVYTDSAAIARAAVEPLLDDPRLPTLVDAVRVHADRWWSLVEVADPAGEPLGQGTLAAEAVYAGLTAQHDRSAAVAAASRPSPQRQAELAVPVSAQLALLDRERDGPGADERRAAAASDLVAAGSSGAVELTEDQLIRLGLLVRDIEVRDDLIAELDHERAQAMVSVWTAVVAVMPDAHAAGPLCLLGLSAWLSGCGALLVGCVERLERDHPDYTMGQLLGQIADRALPPSAWTGLGDRVMRR